MANSPCPDCGEPRGSDGYCETCDGNRRAHEALYSEDYGGMSWDEPEDTVQFCENCHRHLNDEGDCPVCDYAW